jgi:predicted glycoside hydrolase/deacetylase ChbG (UPF0249 family)
MRRLLIINADDFGMDDATTDGIIEAHLSGVVSSTSVVTNCEGFEYALQRLKDCSTLKAGVHLNFYQGKPLVRADKVSSLINPATGKFDSTTIQYENVDPDQLKAEFRAQIQRFVDYGLTPTHIDNHRPEIYLHYNLFRVVVELAEEFQLPLRLPFDANFAGGDKALASLARVTWEIVESIGQRIRRDVLEKKIRHPDYFIYEFTALGRTEESLERILQKLPVGISEICTHPGLKGARQLEELSVLKSSNIARTIRELGIQLCSFDMLRPRREGGTS